MTKSLEIINPSICIDSPEEENEETESFITANAKDTYKDETEAPNIKLTSNPSMLNIVEHNLHNLQTCRRPSTVSRFSWGGASVFSRVTYIPSTGNYFILFFVTCIAFILGLMVGGFSVNLFLCDSFNTKHNVSDSNRQGPWLL